MANVELLCDVWRRVFYVQKVARGDGQRLEVKAIDEGAVTTS
jgi:hypothetical protein